MANSGITSESIIWKKELPLKYKADVAVIGGGIAGVAAACAASREGAEVILIERFAVTGGNATVGGVANWSGETAGQGKIFDEIISMQEEWNSIAPYKGPANGFENCNRVFDHEILALILQEILLKYKVKLLLHTKFVDIERKENLLGNALIAGAAGAEGLSAKVYIDASGDAMVAAAAGCEMLPGAEYGPLPPSMMFFVREMAEDRKPQLPGGWFNPVTRKEDLPMTSTWPNGELGKALKVKVPGFDTSNTVGMSNLEIRARQRMWEVLDFFQRNDKKNYIFDHCSPYIGLRETRRIDGDYMLTADDLRAGKSFDDGIARGVFHLDGMRPDDEKRTYLIESREEREVPPYHVPFRSLVPKGIDNLLVAGRCISADQLALSSARVMTTCAMMGQATGVAAAWASSQDKGIRNLDYTKIRNHLEKHGANLVL